MLKKLKKWFGKGDEDIEMHLPKNENETFVLMVDHIEMATLHCEDGIWIFKYSDEFKQKGKDYNLITGFPDINKEYRDETLWPFFRIRIPGLKQPAIQEIIKHEKIDQQNEVALLKRFGQRTISNPYELIPR